MTARSLPRVTAPNRVSRHKHAKRPNELRTYVRALKPAKKEEVIVASGKGLSDRQIAELMDVPRSTVGFWLRRSRTATPPREPPFERDALPTAPYAYLLGAYLGDGCLSRQSNGSWTLRIVSDTAYPGVLDEFAASMEGVSGGTSWRRKRPDMNAIDVGLTWRHWTLALPQHGPGRKHKRKIELEPWQWDMVQFTPACSSVALSTPTGGADGTR